MECEKADAHGQEDVPRLKVAAHHLSEHTRKEVGVFEIKEQTEVDEQTQRNEKSAKCPFGAKTVDGSRQKIVAHGDDGEEKEVKSATFIIKIIRKCGDKEQARREPPLQTHIDKGETQKQKEKKPTRKNHRLFGVVAQRINQSFYHYFSKALRRL